MKRKQTLIQLKRKLKKITHAIVRKNAVSCFTCGATNRKLSAGHFWSDGGHPATKFDFDNLRPQCDSCNMWQSGNLANYAIRLAEEIGQEKYHQLYERACTSKCWTREELEQLIEERKNL